MTVILQHKISRKKLRHITIKVRLLFYNFTGSEFYGNFTSLRRM